MPSDLIPLGAEGDTVITTSPQHEATVKLRIPGTLEQLVTGTAGTLLRARAETVGLASSPTKGARRVDEPAPNPSKLPDDVLKLCYVLAVVALHTLDEHLEEYGLDLGSLDAGQVSDLVHSYADQEVEWQFAVAHAQALRGFAARQGLRKREPVERAQLRKLDLRGADESS